MTKKTAVVGLHGNVRGPVKLFMQLKKKSYYVLYQLKTLFVVKLNIFKETLAETLELPVIFFFKCIKKVIK